MILGAVFRRLLGKPPGDAAQRVDGLRHAHTALEEGRVQDAEVLIERVLSANPRDPNAYAIRAVIARSQRKFLAAIADFRRASALDPGSSDIRIELSMVLHTMGRFDEALAALDEALAVSPTSALAHMGRGLMLKELGRFAEAEVALDAACALDADNLQARCHLAAVLHDQGRSDAAEAILVRVLAEDPMHVEAHWILALLQLSGAQFGAGWLHYAHRLRRHDASVQARAMPWWDGADNLRGALLVLAEQGLGDQIMFASCYADLLAHVPDCVLECDRRLVDLFSRSFSSARVIAAGDRTALPAATNAIPDGVVAQMAAGSLPGLYRRQREDFPAHRGYLRTDPGRVAHWRGRLDALGPGIKVGMSWIGGGVKTRRAMRSLPLQELAPVLRVPGVQFISLQYTECTAELDALSADNTLVVHHWAEAHASYDDTASLVSALDLVISVTTSLVHLAGALGKPVWVLVPRVAEWRYLRAGSAMPWYPSARLFRQQVLWDWECVVAEAEQALRAQAACDVVTPPG